MEWEGGREIEGNCEKEGGKLEKDKVEDCGYSRE